MTLPDGSVKHVADAAGNSFNIAVPTVPRGVHRVEILADGPFGVEVLANFPVFAGVPEPAIVAAPRTDAAAASDPATAPRLPPSCSVSSMMHGEPRVSRCWSRTASSPKWPRRTAAT